VNLCQCGARLALSAVACAACLAISPPAHAPGGHPHVVTVENQQPTAMLADVPDQPHVPEGAYPAHIPGSTMTQAPPPVLGVANLQGEGTLTAGGIVAAGAQLSGAGRLSAG
jgi:hypothetical protein